jgi:hypothetical protein
MVSRQCDHSRFAARDRLKTRRAEKSPAHRFERLSWPALQRRFGMRFRASASRRALVIGPVVMYSRGAAAPAAVVICVLNFFYSIHLHQGRQFLRRMRPVPSPRGLTGICRLRLRSFVLRPSRRREHLALRRQRPVMVQAKD